MVESRPELNGGASGSQPNIDGTERPAYNDANYVAQHHSQHSVSEHEVSRSEAYHVGEYVDVLDTINKWCNASVLEVDNDQKRVFVHYTGYAAKYDEWISTVPIDYNETVRI